MLEPGKAADFIDMCTNADQENVNTVLIKKSCSSLA